MILLLSVLVGRNKDTIMKTVGDFVRVNVGLNRDHDMMFDHSEITLTLTELKDKVDTMAKDMNTLKESVNDNLDKIQVTMDDVKNIHKN